MMQKLMQWIFNIKALELFLYYDLKKLIHGLAHYSIKLQKRDS